MRRYLFKWRSLDDIGAVDKIREFNDVQWKDYGARVADDQNGYILVIPYTSIYDIQILTDEETE